MFEQQVSLHKEVVSGLSVGLLQVGECAAVVVFECGEEVLVERLRKRGETSGRVDDNDDTIRKRLTTFSASTLPVVQHYQSLGRTRMVHNYIHSFCEPPEPPNYGYTSL